MSQTIIKRKCARKHIKRCQIWRGKYVKKKNVSYSFIPEFKLLKQFSKKSYKRQIVQQYKIKQKHCCDRTCNKFSLTRCTVAIAMGLRQRIKRWYDRYIFSRIFFWQFVLCIPRLNFLIRTTSFCQVISSQIISNRKNT